MEDSGFLGSAVASILGGYRRFEGTLGTTYLVTHSRIPEDWSPSFKIFS
jgi:hypothetical protein